MIETSESARPAPAVVIRPGGAGTLLQRILQGAVAAYLLAAAAAFVVSLVLANTWLALPFPGALYNRDLVFTSAAPIGGDHQWDLHRQGIREGDQLIAVDGLPVRTSADVRFALGRFVPGQSTSIEIRAEDGGESTLDVSLGAFRLQDQTAYFILPAILGLLFLSLSAWVLVTRRTETAGRALAIFLSSLSIAASGFFDLFTTHVLTPVWIVSLAIAGAALIDLALSFPKESALARRFPLAHGLGFLAAIGTVGFPALWLIGSAPANSAAASWRATCVFVSLALLAFFLLNVYHGLRAQSPVVKTQARMIAAATALALVPLFIWSAVSALGSKDFTPYVVLPIALLPVTLAYAMLRFRVAGAARVLRQGVIYVLLSLLLLGAYALLVTGLSLAFSTAMPAASPLWIGGLAFLLAVLLEPVRTRLQRMADRTFFRGQRAVDEAVQGFANDLGNAVDLDSVSRVVRQAVASVVDPAAMHVFVHDELNDQYAAMRDDTKRPSTDIRFGARGSLAQHFMRERAPLHLDGKLVPPGLQADHSRLALLGARLLLPLSGRDRPLGWISLGARRAGQPYTPGNTTILEQLADQVSIAISRVQTVEKLERRIQEMDALTRVAQGVNITLTFDDVLELIYAQTTQIVPLSHFHITLHRPDEDEYYLAFALEDHERLAARENTPLPSNMGLAGEVIRRGRPIITENYNRECKAMGVTPIADGISAWMGVPLNAGAESIGALSVGSRDAGAAYTRGQLELLQAVADQTAGAIVKARLLRETQQRAAQLSKLNDVTRQLASTLEMDPLRQNIVDGAASILDCEAGILYLLDQPTGELIVRAAAAPLANDILGQHVPAGIANAARAAANRSPSIDNDLAPGSGAHFLDHTGSEFVAHTSLAVPLQVQDSILGVLELMNRRDGGPFVPEDQVLMMAFAGQAAVALENVRLYTLTDQELTARVEELSVMQRIDRELNASLEMDRAMRITLEWALRQSDAEAGLIGLLENGRLRVVTELGYGQALGNAVDQALSLALPGFQPAIDSGLPQRVRFEAANVGGFLPATDHQVVIPIRREATVIGLLVLESTKPAQEDLGFLSRLSDHAAIAISNAQLYDEVQRANIAKSDFVSLVAHELKNPMTSIKGYAELLAAGAVGPVNEMQANFLSTIRSNTERMSTLVSDLNDNSKIEAGRLRLDFKSVELAVLIDEVVRSTSGQIEEKKQVIRMELLQHLPHVWADPTRLGQVLTNLVSNSHKYTAEGGALVIGAEPSANHWDPQGASRVVHVWLRDNGIGISPEDQQRIFQKFFRSEDPKAREVPGAGLGLNITRSLVEMQGGRIWFESQYRHGTTFHFTVPVAEA
ncbi:MAG: GAF domain-containing protein [Chloroflexota bacterium]